MSSSPGPSSSHSNPSINQLEYGNNGKDRRWFSRLAKAVQLLPSNAFFAFQTLSPSFTNSAVEECYPSNQLLTCFLITYLALVNLLFSFLDSFELPGRDKTYFGIATRKGFHVLNMSSKRKKKMDVYFKNALDKKYKLRWIDWIHAFVSFAVFAALAISDADVSNCLLPDLNDPDDPKRMFFNFLPLALTSFAILVFFFFPSKRRGLGTIAANIHRGERNVTVSGSQTSKHVDVDDKTQKNDDSSNPNRKEPSTRMGMGMGMDMVVNLDQLLPNNILLLFQALAPFCTNSGRCSDANKYLTISLIIFCAMLCLFFSFTDTFILDPDDDKGKLYLGIATYKGLFVINKSTKDKETEKKIKEISAHKEFKICATDWTHAVVSFALFGAFGISDRNVLKCFFPKMLEFWPNLTQLFINLPFALALLASLIFFMFPTTRSEIGYGHAILANILGENTATATPVTDGNIHGENAATASPGTEGNILG